MNRRTFLKTTAITATALPLVGCEFKPRTENPQWIKLLDQQPNIGQKILLINRHNHTYKHYGLTGGIVKQLDIGLSDENNNVIIKIGVDFLTYGQDPVMVGSATAEGKKIITSRKWCFFEDHDELSPYQCGDITTHTRTEHLTNCYWLDAEKGYPIDLPPMPKIVSKWIAFEDQMPEPTDKFEMRRMNDEFAPIKRGEILEFQTPKEGIPIHTSNKEFQLHGKRTFIMYRMSKDCLHVVDHKKWDWRYIT